MSPPRHGSTSSARVCLGLTPWSQIRHVRGVLRKFKSHSTRGPPEEEEEKEENEAERGSKKRRPLWRDCSIDRDCQMIEGYFYEWVLESTCLCVLELQNLYTSSNNEVCLNSHRPLHDRDCNGAFLWSGAATSTELGAAGTTPHWLPTADSSQNNLKIMSR